jgi:hypothetical protein
MLILERADFHDGQDTIECPFCAHVQAVNEHIAHYEKVKNEDEDNDNDNDEDVAEPTECLCSEEHYCAGVWCAKCNALFFPDISKPVPLLEVTRVAALSHPKGMVLKEVY